MTYLVTGGAGFIGGNFLEYMVLKYPNDYFICLDKLTYASNIHNLDNIKDKSNFNFIKDDICNKLDYIFNEYKIDIIVNFAAESHVTKSIEEPNLFLKTNVDGTFNLLEYARHYNIKRFHQISTDEVYGSLDLDSENKFTEESILNPSTPYAASKACADMLVLSYFKTYNIPVTISRCANNFGKYQYKEKLIPLVISKILNNEVIPIHGDGTHIRDYIYVTDHVKGIDLILKKGIEGNVYNISGNNLISTKDMINIIKNKMDKEVKTIFVEDRLGNDKKYNLDDSKIRVLGFKNEFDFETDLDETINWYLNN